MTTITLPDELAEQLNLRAREKGLALMDYLREVARGDLPQSQLSLEPIDDFIGLIKADVTDASMTVKETVRAHFRKKFSGYDDDSR